jgi:cytoskeletal protein RodZ
LGEWLQQRREELDLSLEQVEEDTRIRIRYLQALESEEFEALPDPVVGRGFLRNYAAYLDLDPQEANERYAAKVAPPLPESLPSQDPPADTAEAFRPVALHEMPGQRSWRGLLVGLFAILVVALALLAWWGYPYIRDWLTGDDGRGSVAAVVTATRSATATSPLSTATQTATATQAPATATEAGGPSATATEAEPPTPELTLTPTLTPSFTPSPSPPIYTGIFLELVFTDTSWVQVTVDDVRQFQGELETDTYRSWYGEERIELRVGNAGAVIVTVNGQNLGTLGAVGDVVDRIFEKLGEEVIENTVTPVPSGTPPTATPTIQAPGTTTPALSPTAPITPTVPITPTAPISPTATITP